MVTKQRFFVLSIITMVVLISGCNAKKTITPTIEDFVKIEVGTQQGEIHKKYGEPAGTLSGLWGDIYVLENKRSVIVYYDNKGNVERITAADADDEKNN